LEIAMRIVFASGKGGTGKTTVATNYAAFLSRRGICTTFCDCDVEAPNGHIFLKPEIEIKEEVFSKVPIVDAGACNLCGKCGEICNFSAIVVLRNNVLTYPELCHSCNGCNLVCPENAISMLNRPIGNIEYGKYEQIKFLSGLLTIGEASAVPLIRELKSRIPSSSTVVLDSPPGTSCPMIETIKDADMVVLVTEPTPFGLNDLKLAVETVRTFSLPFAVVINRSDIGDNGVLDYCDSEEIEIIA